MKKKDDCIKEKEDYVICDKNGEKITVIDIEKEWIENTNRAYYNPNKILKALILIKVEREEE